MAEPGEAQRLLRKIQDALERRLEEQPYPILALATMVGYVAGGGFFSRLTRPLARAAMGALLVPGVRERLRGSTGRAARAEIAGAV